MEIEKCRESFEAYFGLERNAKGFYDETSEQLMWLACKFGFDYAGGQPERLLSTPSDVESCAPDRQGEALICRASCANSTPEFEIIPDEAMTDDDQHGDAYAKGYGDGYKAKALAVEKEADAELPVELSEDIRAIFEEGARGYFHNGPVHPALYRSDRVRPDQYFHSDIETAWRFFQYGWNSRQPEREYGELSDEQTQEAAEVLGDAMYLPPSDVMHALSALLERFEMRRRHG